MEVPADWRLDGRVCVITGATAGIGRHGSLALARLGADLVLVGRSRRRIERAEGDLRRVNPGVRVTGMIADLSSQRSVRELARQVLERVPRVHVLINNAGVFTARRAETVDGLEMQFAVNHLAPFLLTNLLLDRLAEGAPARVVAVASQVERTGAIDFDDLQGQRKGAYDGHRAYRQSKLANILFTRELANRVRGRGITPISLHPGVYTTRLLDNYMGWSGLVTRVWDRGLPEPEAGGWVLAHAAAAPELADRPGVHLHEHTVAEPSAQAQDPELARRLWIESARLTGLES